jgi:hypothetical protein
MPQRAAPPPLTHGRDGTVYLVLDDFGELGSAYRETDAAQADLTTVVADLLSGHIDFPCAWWPSTPPTAGRATSVQTSRARLSLVHSSWIVTCQLRCALSWSGRVRESRHDVSAAPDPSLKGTARPYARPGDDPSLVRHGLSVP